MKARWALGCEGKVGSRVAPLCAVPATAAAAGAEVPATAAAASAEVPATAAAAGAEVPAGRWARSSLSPGSSSSRCLYARRQDTHRPTMVPWWLPYKYIIHVMNYGKWACSSE